VSGNDNDNQDDKNARSRDFSSSLSELKEALKDTADLGQDDASDTISTSYAKSHADQNVDLARRNLEQDPTNPMLRDWLAFNLYASGRYDEACVLYEKCLAENADNADQHYYLGNCYFKLGDIARACVQWRAVLQLDDTSKCAKKALDKLTRTQAS